MKKAYKLRLLVASIILFIALIAFFGLYPIRLLDIQIAPLAQRVASDFSKFAIMSLCVLLMFTIFFGRFYCSALCPFGIVQELAILIYNKLKGKKLPNIEYIKKTPYKYFISALTFGALIGGSALFIRYIDPYTLFGSWVTLTKYGIIVGSIIVVLVFFKNRFFCTSICPIGALLGLLSKFAPFKIYIKDECIQCGMCSRYCQSKCIDKDNKTVDNENCIKCLKCTSVCPKGAIKYGLYHNKSKFDISKRKALISTGAFTLFIGSIAIGVKFSKDLYSKFKNIILPAGAKDSQRMANKCLNCNLCINICPNKILKKADSNYPAIHIDYTQGEHYCKYDCNKCSEACLSGAIRKITLKEKQNTRIAMAAINNHCIGCQKCINKCPKGAITLDGEAARIDGSVCIGCGACKAICPMGAIDIYSINKQTEI